MSQTEDFETYRRFEEFDFDEDPTEWPSEKKQRLLHAVAELDCRLAATLRDLGFGEGDYS